jgi:hypothetical protein
LVRCALGDFYFPVNYPGSNARALSEIRTSALFFRTTAMWWRP